MTCREFRDRCFAQIGSLGGLEGTNPREIDAHLAACQECAALARRLSAARQALAQPALPESEVGHAAPDSGFASRVVARISRPTELLGWAAFRALPAALALALALAWLGISQPVSPSSLLLDEPSPDQLLAWSSLAPEDLL